MLNFNTMKNLIILTTLLAQLALNAQPIRGVWLTNVGSTAMLNKRNIQKAVNQCSSKGINTIYVVVWNNGVTMYPSKLIQSYIGILQDTVYKGFDPLASLIILAHAKRIKVHAWFEFGASYSYKSTNSPWLTKYPNWAAKDSSGALLQKNGFYWWNAIHPEVQNLLQSLMLEVIVNYKVDGVQGDDRLPAMPAEGGYDDYTKELYIKETKLKVPSNYREPKFLQWKSDKLSEFGKRMYQAVKKQNPKCIVSWAPSIYPWSKEQYLQDWPQWLAGGYADIILPQLYRYDIKAYEKILKELNEQLTPAQKLKVFPGVLTALGDGYQISDTMLQQIIALNRKYGYQGECFFYYEFLPKIKKLY